MNDKVLFPTELTENNKYLKNYLIAKFSKYVDLLKSDILEIGIGNGKFGFLLGKFVAHYYGIDIDEEYVKIAKKNIPWGARIIYRLGDAENIPFLNKFDIIFYAQSWHFIKNHQKALEEAKRALKPKGIFAILEPSENSKNWVSPKLRQDSPEFDKNLYRRKLEELKDGKRAVLEQRLFDMIEDEYRPETTLNLYILSLNF